MESWYSNKLLIM